VIEGTGQPLFPAIQFEDGGWYREESQDTASGERLTAERLESFWRCGAVGSAGQRDLGRQ
jgi:hypothetical protein